MLKTWKVDPEERPAFSSLVACMGDFLESNVKQVCLLFLCLYIAVKTISHFSIFAIITLIITLI